MTSQTRAVNKAKFEQGDRPQGSDYVDLIDSFLSLADSTAQQMTSDLQVPTLSATTVTADTVNASAANFAQVSANVGYVSGLTVTRVSGDVAVFDEITTSAFAASGANIGRVGVGTAAPTAVRLHVAGNVQMDVDTSAEASAGNGGKVPLSAQAFGLWKIGATEYWVPLFKVKS